MMRHAHQVCVIRDLAIWRAGPTWVVVRGGTPIRRCATLRDVRVAVAGGAT